jgi:prepilin-type N-terminal cleavage/methylation domain-containing protein
MRFRFPAQKVGRARRGFTALELMMTLVVASIILAFVAPRFAGARETTSVHTARDHVISYLNTAKAAAVRRGATARFRMSGNRIWVTVLQDSTFTPLAGSVQLKEQFKVDAISTEIIFAFDSRGFASALSGDTPIVLSRGAAADTVCVTRGGAILRGGCNL